MALLKNRFFLAFTGIYLISLAVLTRVGGQSVIEPLFIFVLFGLALPGIAYLICHKAKPLFTRVEISKKEIGVLAAYIVFIAFFLGWGTEYVERFVYGLIERTPQSEFFVTLIKKLLFLVLIPFLLFWKLFGYSLKDFGFSTDWRAVFAPRHVVVMLFVSVAFMFIQFLMGQAAQPLKSGEFALTAMLIGGVLAFLWLVVEVGLVEEFFFRGMVQSRMAAWFNSELSGIFAMALIFGLAHAPGLYLRGAGVVTPLGAEPDLIATVAYSIVMLSIAGLVFGVVWARTRNLYILILMHAAGDLLPNLPEFLETFGLK